MTAATAGTAAAAERLDAPPRSGIARLGGRGNPWRRPWFLEGFTWLYLAWSLLPLAVAVLYSFNNGKSQSVWQGFSLQWYYHKNSLVSVFQSPALQESIIQTLRLSAYTALIAVPLGVAFALGINRWRGRTSATFNFVMILSYVVPELIFGVAMFFAFTVLFRPVGLGTIGQTLALVTWNVSWPAIVVQARLVTLGKQYEEAAADLGASRMRTIWKVMLPLLGPAIFASAVLVISSVIDDFVIVDLLSSTANTQPMSVLIYSQQHGGNGAPALNALGTVSLLLSLVIALLGFLGYRLMTRKERGDSSTTQAMTGFIGG